jgi:4-hydroxy-tetrahydrodipicolinate synthase
MEAASTLLSLSKPSGGDSAMVRGGFYCYLATPFDAAGDVDLGQLAEYVSEMLTCDLAGLTCMASTCEGPYLTDAEWRLALETVGKIAGGKTLLNVGVGAYSTRQAVENAKRAKDAGATSLMVEMPQYYPVQFEDVYRHYAAIAEQVDLPIRLYNLTLPTRFDFTPDRLRKMAEISRIDSVKEASGEVSRLEDIRIECSDRFALFCGFHFQLLDGLRLGADGWEVMMHPLIAARLTRLYAALKKDPWSRAGETMFRELAPLFEFFRRNGVPQSIKAMSEWSSMRFGSPRSPQRSLNDAERRQLRQILQASGVL